MPKDAPPLKLKATQSYGGNVIFYDRYTEVRDEVAERVMKTLPKGTVFIPPYDHKHVIAGQGTVGKELIEDLQSKSITLDYLFGENMQCLVMKIWPLPISPHSFYNE